MAFDEFNMVDRARAFARSAHGSQTYGRDGLSYGYHLEKVHNVMLWMGITDPEMLAAALLHDTIEDTQVRYGDVRDAFDMRVAELVYAVTDELGRNRTERHEKTYPKINANPDAILLKLADRIANVEYGWSLYLEQKVGSPTPRMLGIYQKEHQAFRDALWHAMAESHKSWQYLDELLKDFTEGNEPTLREGA